MPYQHATAFGTTYGNLTDDERLRASQGMNQAQIAAQMAALQAEINDRQAGRAFQGGQAGLDRTQQSTMFDKSAALQTGLDQNATQRALGVTGLQMGPANAAAQLERDKYNDTADQRAFKAQVFRQLTGIGGPVGQGATAMPVASSASAAPGTAGAGVVPSRFGSMDPDAMMFMAMGGNPGDYMMQKRQETAMNLNRQDAQDARSVDIAKAFLASDKPEARALGAQLLSGVKNIGLAGTDPATLQTALQPEADPTSLVGKSPALQKSINDAATLLKRATQVGGSQDQIEQAKPILAGLAKELIAHGAKADDAQAYIANQLKGILPANTTITDDILRAIFTAGIGNAVLGGADARTKAARQVAGLVD